MDNSSSTAASTDSTEALPTASAAEPAAKKKRNLPGMPDPEAEVIALSPKTLMATNRFVCEICSKGFQRDQNLQLHRRGHNLPWKLKQRTGKEIPRKRVYVCPETSCVHHSPARALGDLTGIKKHFCRKHGEKKWKCERCTKKYAVQSDWKAHMKVCGTKEYKCDCGTVFSRRDSFITHRAFCDALAEESSKPQTNLGLPLEGKSDPPSGGKRSTPNVIAAPPSPPRSPSTTPVSPVQSIQSSENAPELLPAAANPDPPLATTETTTRGGPTQLQSPSALSSIVCPSVESNRIDESLPPPPSTEPSASLSLFLSSTTSSIFSRAEQSHRLFAPSQPPTMSATALLQKAAQMGATASNSSLLRGLGLAMSSSYENTTAVPTANVSHTSSTAATWGEQEPFDPTDHSLGLGLASQERPSLLMSQSSLFGPKPLTLDFLGLGAPRSGLSALLTSLESGFGSGSPAPCGGGTWDGGAV